ncbi:MAG: deoxyribonuclease IV [bacterium]|nr:deoxyribonuclease IV [bacterium]
MMLIGSHVSFDKEEQLVKSVKEAISYGSTTFMFYTGAPQNTNRSKIKDEKTKEAIRLMQDNNIDIDKVIVHAPYIINLANLANLDFGVRFLKEELERSEQLGIKYIVLHPGSHVGVGIEEGIKNIILGLNTTLKNYQGDIKILLETMAGKGTEIGSKLEELKQIIDGVDQKEKIGVCLDTCHLNDSGYDVDDIDNLLIEVDNIIGLDKVYCIHLNDSKNDKSSHKDRHENFGFGRIGFDTLIKYVYHPKLEHIPKILETPYIDKTYPPYRYEIKMIQGKKFLSDLIEKIRKKEEI